MLCFNWTFVRFAPTEMLIQLTFENFNYVSSHNTNLDKIQVEIFGF